MMLSAGVQCKHAEAVLWGGKLNSLLCMSRTNIYTKIHVWWKINFAYEDGKKNSADKLCKSGKKSSSSLARDSERNAAEVKLSSSPSCVAFTCSHVLQKPQQSWRHRERLQLFLGNFRAVKRLPCCICWSCIYCNHRLGKCVKFPKLLFSHRRRHFIFRWDAAAAAHSLLTSRRLLHWSLLKKKMKNFKNETNHNFPWHDALLVSSCRLFHRHLIHLLQKCCASPKITLFVWNARFHHVQPFQL